jgi:hypothetical protein
VKNHHPFARFAVGWYFVTKSARTKNPSSLVSYFSLCEYTT